MIRHRICLHDPQKTEPALEKPAGNSGHGKIFFFPNFFLLSKLFVHFIRSIRTLVCLDSRACSASKCVADFSWPLMTLMKFEIRKSILPKCGREWLGSMENTSYPQQHLLPSQRKGESLKNRGTEDTAVYHQTKKLHWLQEVEHNKEWSFYVAFVVFPKNLKAQADIIVTAKSN